MSRLVVIAGACLALSGGVSGAAPGTASGSWSDTLHGWARSTDALTCTPRADLCATDDGGATWHGIFNGAVDSFVRTSTRAGAVSLDDGRVFWTRDRGRHWYRTNRIFGKFAGAGASLFATSDADLYRVTPWPPRARTRCRTWRTVAHFGSSGGSNVCVGGAVDAGMHDRLVTTVRGRTIGALTAVPGGVFGVVDYAPDFSQLDAFVWRNGRLTQTTLPFPQPAWWCCADVSVAWPSLFVSASLYVPPATAGSPVPVLWRSTDAGATWTSSTGN